MSNSPSESTHSSSSRENPSGYSNSTKMNRRNSRESPMAFYEIPSWVENVPSKIINNAKQSLRDMPTTRPYTPRDDSRYTLSKLNHDSNSFSASSIDYEAESRPGSSKTADVKRRNSKGLIAGISDNSVLIAAPPPPRLSKIIYQTSQDQVRSGDSNISNETKPPLPSNHQRSNVGSTSTQSTTTKSSHHRTSSASTKDDSSEENLIWKHEIGPLVDTLITAYKKNHFEQFDLTCNDLYNSLLKHNLFAKKSNKKRGELLKTLFGFISSENSFVRFHVARLSLAFQISSANNLRHIICITADLTSNKNNDHFFLNTNILDLLFETIPRIDIEQNLESIAYFCTTLKNLTVNNELICLISEKRPFELLKNILKRLLQLKDQAQLFEQLLKCLIPLTGTLRNLAENDLNRREFLSDELINHLTFILKYFTDKTHEDLMKNVVRLLSKLTQHTDCCMKLVQCSSCYRSFLKILVKHESNQALVVRICFILGNMMAKSEDARLTFMKDTHALQTLTKLLHSYVQLDSLVLKPEKLDNDDSISQDADVTDDSNITQFRSIENVINKVIRVLSNLAISEENGLIIIRRDDCIDLLFKLIKSPNNHSEELLVHVLMALNNLSYYDDSQSYINRNSETLAQLLVKYIRNEERMDCVVEAFRVLGNLSRTNKIRDILMKCKVDRLAIHHCQSDNVELLYAAIGVLINLTVDEDKRECLKIHHGIDNLINIFEYSVQSDWQLSSLVCKALWNYCDNNYEKADNQPLWFTEDQLKVLLTLFDETLNESGLESTDDESLDELNKQLWNEEYFPVASRLYQRVIEGNEYFKTVQINDHS
ncbi:unnamed protein product [Rotaria socialis]|uniref:Armadillo repeat-containing protein 2 n=1 Tax=Rotaria socialis TaxID=392032 RepID=A0A817SPL1_9BILA|nr:unnamed protein product [Rotaria socialis]CAF3402202.1 unnamed protein product [Rotaria socialis]CAF3413240.1 unnamed protein product [Rotaria socialis]CAF4114418.1 unnamed protein product [Rotaria socialis]CAF4230849.1 unnamed protein product [Rotaria socialis]